jgi:hypothetical protein
MAVHRNEQMGAIVQGDDRMRIDPGQAGEALVAVQHHAEAARPGPLGLNSSLDRVLQIGSPKGVGRLIQR